MVDASDNSPDGMMKSMDKSITTNTSLLLMVKCFIDCVVNRIG